MYYKMLRTIVWPKEVQWYSSSTVVSLNGREPEAENESKEKQNLSSVVHHSCGA